LALTVTQTLLETRPAHTMIIFLLALAFMAGVVVGLRRFDEVKSKPGLLTNTIWASLQSPGRRPSATAELEKGQLSQSGGERLLYTKEQIEARFDHSSWQRGACEDFREKMLARANLKTFPCIYATMGYRAGEHRYHFLQTANPADPPNIKSTGAALKMYLSLAPTLGANTSLVIFAAPSEEATPLTQHTTNFWGLLRGLRIVDPCPWPNDIPTKTASSTWTFAYAGEPIFPVLLTPSHSKRFSRHMSVPTIAIQPKWVLDKLLDTPEHRETATGKVRKLLKDYDTLDISPDLTSFGQPGTTESRQLCLDDENETVSCPYEDFDR
jgi:uncharacterized protein